MRRSAFHPHAACGEAGTPASTHSTAPPATRPGANGEARYLAAVAAPLRDWRTALEVSAAALRDAARGRPGAGRRPAVAAARALEAASGRAAGAVRSVAAPPSIDPARQALLRSIDLTGRGSHAVARRVRDRPVVPTRRVHALQLAAGDTRTWVRALPAPVPRWAPRLAAASASLAHAARAALAPQTLAPGAGGAAVSRLQRRPGELRYLPSAYATGSYDERTMHAIVAIQGWEGLSRDGVAGPVTLRRLVGAEAPQPWSTAGRHIEIHKSQQVVLLVDGGSVVRAIHVSTAAPGHVTPDGTFTVYRKELMSWSVPFQVWMPYASYFFEGYALHEYPDVPPYPASHGCVRVPSAESSPSGTSPPWVRPSSSAR